MAACVAVDFNFDEDSCWLHLDPRDLLDENTYSQDNTHQYRIDRTCAADTTLSGLLSFLSGFVSLWTASPSLFIHLSSLSSLPSP